MSEVEIQCPECGGMISYIYKNGKRILHCNDCKIIYDEDKIRERCGI